VAALLAYAPPHLHLAALSLQGRSDVQHFLADFTGSHRHIVDYLVEEVLARQPEAVQAFLLHTAILDRLTGPLCDAVTGGTNSDVLLEQLERANLFLVYAMSLFGSETPHTHEGPLAVAERLFQAEGNRCRTGGLNQYDQDPGAQHLPQVEREESSRSRGAGSPLATAVDGPSRLCELLIPSPSSRHKRRDSSLFHAGRMKTVHPIGGYT
jgi:hypothetical protein